MKQSNAPIIAIHADVDDPEDRDVTEAALLVALKERRRRVYGRGSADNTGRVEGSFAQSRSADDLLASPIAAQFGRSRPGRPVGSDKERITIRLDSDALARFRADGPGWQTRINAAVRKAAGLA